MMPYQTHLLFEAERTRGEAGRRQADIRPGRAAAGTPEPRGALAGLARAAARLRQIRRLPSSA
jgi:hypothetical protein